MQDRIGHLHLHTALTIDTLAAIQHVYSTQQNRIRHRSARYAAALPMTANGANIREIVQPFDTISCTRSDCVAVKSGMGTGIVFEIMHKV